MHDIWRWADDFRHYAASSLNAQAVGGNTGAAIYWSLGVLIVGSIVYPPLRHWIEHELNQVHAKLDHIVKHSPEIPNIPAGRFHHRTGEQIEPKQPKE